MGVDKNSTPGAYELLIKKADTLDCIRHTPYGDVIPSNKELSGASVELVRQEADEEQKRDLKHQHHLPPVELLVVPEAHVNGLGRHGPENKGCDRDQIFQTHAPFAAQKRRAQKKDVAGPRVGKDLPAAD